MPYQAGIKRPTLASVRRHAVAVFTLVWADTTASQPSARDFRGFPDLDAARPTYDEAVRWAREDVHNFPNDASWLTVLATVGDKGHLTVVGSELIGPYAADESARDAILGALDQFPDLLVEQPKTRKPRAKAAPKELAKAADVEAGPAPKERHRPAVLAQAEAAVAAAGNSGPAPGERPQKPHAKGGAAAAAVAAATLAPKERPARQKQTDLKDKLAAKA